MWITYSPSRRSVAWRTLKRGTSSSTCWKLCITAIRSSASFTATSSLTTSWSTRQARLYWLTSESPLPTPLRTMKTSMSYVNSKLEHYFSSHQNYLCKSPKLSMPSCPLLTSGRLESLSTTCSPVFTRGKQIKVSGNCSRQSRSKK